MGKKSDFEMLREFHRTFGEVGPNVPTPLSKTEVEDEYSIILGEIVEGMRTKIEYGQGGSMLLRVALILEELAELLGAEDIVDQADALGDARYLISGTFEKMGINGDPIIEIIHRANMEKLWDDGKPHRNEFGKIIKPPNWEEDHAPEKHIGNELLRQWKIYVSPDSQKQFEESMMKE